MKFKSVPEFRTYLQDKLLSKKVARSHLNIFEDTREMTDIKTDKTNQTWDWMKGFILCKHLKRGTIRPMLS